MPQQRRRGRRLKVCRLPRNLGLAASGAPRGARCVVPVVLACRFSILILTRSARPRVARSRCIARTPSRSRDDARHEAFARRATLALSRCSKLLARRFPRPDVLPSITPLQATLLEQGNSGPVTQSEQVAHSAGSTVPRPRVEPLSAASFRVEFTASAELRQKLELAQNLLSHAVSTGDLAALVERALDELLAAELRRRMGAERPRARRSLGAGSRRADEPGLPLEPRQAGHRAGATRRRRRQRRAVAPGGLGGLGLSVAIGLGEALGSDRLWRHRARPLHGSAWPQGQGALRAGARRNQATILAGAMACRSWHRTGTSSASDEPDSRSFSRVESRA